ncbi:glucans biosynthesis glucosyltransferase MdoH [Eilatimonas milleporae]|uniref:glucans biosynthesis glucosyltransferase MdoH n=1 Tax=Eilatimonas milleporae TaxID=911205 RepID=UPI001FEB3F01|nr:glucans biosynthesis glucosyltransferase MdoH [Eilatimonas milleporae]
MKHGFTGGCVPEGAFHPDRPALPPECRLDMPRQGVHAPRRPLRLKNRSRTARIGTAVSRAVLAVGTLLLAAFGAREMHGVMAAGGLTALQWVFLVFFTLNFAWVAFAACQCLLGFLRRAARDLARLLSPATPPPSATPPSLYTAVLLPVYNEDPHMVAAAVSAMAAALSEKAPDRFCFFILSDTNRAADWLREESVFSRLTRRVPAACPVYYRHRRANTERKAGNVADWVMRWGGAHDAMLILDADSLMSAETMIALARRLEEDPGLGLIQTAPAIIGGHTLFARLQQFANRCYGPIYADGLAAWHGPGSNFWGHNAIIRTHAFASAARLPHLSGAPPFGGHVMSHDFIEAALLRRAGWGVRLDTDLDGSYEQAPPSLSDVMIRDRRWCQGNLQHARFLGARGLALTTRLHLLGGIMAYMSALFWLILVGIGLLLAVQAAFTRPEYFAVPSLFPTWPVFDAERAIRLFILSLAVVLLPKGLGWLSACLNPRRCWAFGGPVLLTAGLLAESVLSALYAPVMMLAQSQIVRDVLSGGDSGWAVQRRGDGSIALADAFRVHRWHMATGLGFGGLAWMLNPHLFWWMLPITGGLILAAPLSWASGRNRFGRALRWFGLLRTPEEKRRKPAIIRAYERALPAGLDPVGGAFDRIVADTDLRNWHLGQLDAMDEGVFDADRILAGEKLKRARGLAHLENWLTPSETVALLHTPRLIAGVLGLAGNPRQQPPEGDGAGAGTGDRDPVMS